jgi:2',3'-cyclic-nucleotide 2'-phosphodiesterase (5'-nucleotidase family)
MYLLHVYAFDTGNITLADIQTVQPFRNTFDVMEIHGRHLRSILEFAVSGYDVTEKRGRFLQIAGMLSFWKKIN